MVGTELRQEASGTIATYGEAISIKYYIQTFSGTDYDNHYITQSGNTVWTKGLHFPLSDMGGDNTGEEYKLLQQGAIRHDDRKIFLLADYNLSGPTIKIGLGSPSRAYYKVLPQGVVPQSIEGVDVYKKAYLRMLNTGSFESEY